MTFKSFAETLSILEKTTLRNEITKILAELFKKSEEYEIDKMCYLLLGRLGPKFESLEFQFAKKMMIRSIARSVSEPEEKINRNFKTLGDLGDVIEKFKGYPPAGGSKVKNTAQITEVYEKLLEIAREEGQGSVERKISGMVDLLSALDPLSSKYLVRMVLNLLRLRFSDMTILDSFSWMEKGDKSLRVELESAYNNCTDIGLIAKTFKIGGLGAIRKIGASAGVPIRPQQSERLTTAEEILEKLEECAVEYKLDGLRAQGHIISNIKNQISKIKYIKKIHKQLSLTQQKEETKIVRIFSRNLEDTTHMFPEIVEAAEKIKVKDAIFDGEAIGVDPKSGKFLPFQETAQRKRKHGIIDMAKKIPLKYFAFDILYLNGESLLGKSFRERRKILENCLK